MNTYTEINSPPPASHPTARRYSLPQLLGATLVSALAAFAVTYHVYRPNTAFQSPFATPANQMTNYYPPISAQYAAPVVPQYAAPVAAQASAPYAVARGFVPTNVCAYGRGACADSVNAPAGTNYPAYRQCTDGKTASTCKCFGVRGRGGADSPVSVVEETLLPNGLCRCVFVSTEGPETSHWAMILGCK